MGPIPSLVVHDDHESDEQEDCGENVSDNAPTVDDVESTEQAPPPSAEISLKRSIRDRQLSTRYPPHEYVNCGHFKGLSWLTKRLGCSSSPNVDSDACSVINLYEG